MKHYVFSLLLAVLTLSSCGKEDHWVEVVTPDVARKRAVVLVEDYTGQECINCPNAAAQLERISESLSTPVITVGMHAFQTGFVRPEMQSKEADLYWSAFKVSKAIPAIVVNRTMQQGQYYSQDINTWETLITTAANEEAEYTLSLSAALQGDKVSLSAEAAPIGEKKSKEGVVLHLWVVEDVIGYQKFPRMRKQDYFHHNVFRGALNGAWGEVLSFSPTARVSRSDYSLPANVKVADNAKVVALLTEGAMGRVLEAAIVPLGKGIVPTDKSTEPTDSLSTMKDATLWLQVEDKAVFTGDTLRADHARRIGNLPTEIESEAAFIKAGTTYGYGDYEVEITKLDHLDDPACGLYQVCVESCEEVSDVNRYTTRFQLREKNLRGDPMVQVHYKINPDRTQIEDVYAVLVEMKKEGKVVARFRIEYYYSPERIDIVY